MLQEHARPEPRPHECRQALASAAYVVGATHDEAPLVRSARATRNVDSNVPPGVPLPVGAGVRPTELASTGWPLQSRMKSPRTSISTQVSSATNTLCRPRKPSSTQPP